VDAVGGGAELDIGAKPKQMNAREAAINIGEVEGELEAQRIKRDQAISQDDANKNPGGGGGNRSGPSNTERSMPRAGDAGNGTGSMRCWV
jgi:hypothetical protein